jgi:hypothetical protein
MLAGCIFTNNKLRELKLMFNPLVLPILGYLRERNSSCSLIDLVNLCEQYFLSIIGKQVDPQIIIFQKNFFVMNALYQIQRDIQKEGLSLKILPLDICMVSNSASGKFELTKRDTELASYYLNWSNLSSITVEEVKALFTRFWQKYSAVDKVDAALTTLGLAQFDNWLEVRQAYKKKVSICHPDKGGSVEDFIKTREAYEVLSFRYYET